MGYESNFFLKFLIILLRPVSSCIMPGDHTSGWWKPNEQLTNDSVYMKYSPWDEEQYKKDCSPNVPPDPDVYCPLRRQGLRAIVDAWVNEASAKARDKVRNDAITWFDGYLELCSHPTQSVELFRLLWEVFFTLAEGISNDSKLACHILPKFARIMVLHPLCVEDALSRHNNLDLYELQCVPFAYKSAFTKLRRAAADC